MRVEAQVKSECVGLSDRKEGGRKNDKSKGAYAPKNRSWGAVGVESAFYPKRSVLAHDRQNRFLRNKL